MTETLFPDFIAHARAAVRERDAEIARLRKRALRAEEQLARLNESALRHTGRITNGATLGEIAAQIEPELQGAWWRTALDELAEESAVVPEIRNDEELLALVEGRLDCAKAYADAVAALGEKRGGPLSTTLGYLIRAGYLVPAHPTITQSNDYFAGRLRVRVEFEPAGSSVVP